LFDTAPLTLVLGKKFFEIEKRGSSLAPFGLLPRLLALELSGHNLTPSVQIAPAKSWCAA
jgi:hypothetical protein